MGLSLKPSTHCSTASVSVNVEGALTAVLGKQAVFDLIATVGFYSILGFILMTYDTPIDDTIANDMAKRPL